MLYYRYRSGSELAIKELIYDELYFASKAECNDPYEGKLFAKFDKNKELWERLINEASDNKYSEFIKQKAIDFFLEKAPIGMEEVLSLSATEFLELSQNDAEKTTLNDMLESIRQYILLNMPSKQYFASFSKRNDNFLMWSHYANNHSGFCLIINAPDKKIYQKPGCVKESVSYTMPEFYMPGFGFTVLDAFEIRDVEYVEEPQFLDGFKCFFNEFTSHDSSDEDYIAQKAEQLQKEYGSTYLVKQKDWQYEEEARILLSISFPYITGATPTLSTYHRLFHYDPSHLVGIIIGAKMTEVERYRIKDIITDKVMRLNSCTDLKRNVNCFVLFEEKLSESNRKVIIEPIEIYKGGTVIDKTHPDFISIYDTFKEQVGFDIIL